MTIAAAESADPGNAVAGAVNSVVARVLVFYVASIALIVAIVPWTSVKVGVSPFSVALVRVGIPGSGDVIAAVILTAVLSCLNSGLYTGSRMLFALSVGVESRGVRAAQAAHVAVPVVECRGHNRDGRRAHIDGVHTRRARPATPAALVTVDVLGERNRGKEAFGQRGRRAEARFSVSCGHSPKLGAVAAAVVSCRDAVPCAAGCHRARRSPPGSEAPCSASRTPPARPSRRR